MRLCLIAYPLCVSSPFNTAVRSCSAERRRAGLVEGLPPGLAHFRAVQHCAFCLLRPPATNITGHTHRCAAGLENLCRRLGQRRVPDALSHAPGNVEGSPANCILPRS